MAAVLRRATICHLRGTEQLAFSYSTLKALSAIEAKLKLDDDALVRDKAKPTD